MATPVAQIESEIRGLIERSRALREQCGQLKDVTTKIWDDICSQKWPHCPVCGSCALTAIRRSTLAMGEDEKTVLAFRCVTGHTWIPLSSGSETRRSSFIAVSSSAFSASGHLSRKL
jgi:hypothetical protein